MTNWADVAQGFIDFLKKPTGLGVAIVGLLIGLAIYLAPIVVLTYLNIDGTNRIVGAITELRVTIQANGAKVANRD